ncbi:MAG: hypothetical protein U0935_19105 [Pirellulales bacterium]
MQAGATGTDNDTDVDGDLLTAVPQTDVAGSNGGRSSRWRSSAR